MTKQGLALMIITAALNECDNHIKRLDTLNKLCDKGCIPVRFVTIDNNPYWLFTVAGIDFHYELNDDKWFVKPCTKNEFYK